MNTKTVVFGLLMIVTLPAFAADTPPIQTEAYQNSVEQDRLRAQTQRLKQKMLQMLEEFRQYPGLAGEVSQVQATLDNLGTLSDKEMRDVVMTLRQASQDTNAGDVKSKLLSANDSQKNIQLTLRSLADKLALGKEASMMRRRLRDLLLRQMANQHLTLALTDGSIPNWEIDRNGTLMSAEQDALKKEISLSLDTLEKIAANPQTPKHQIFVGALDASKKTQVADQANTAATNAAAKDYKSTVTSQGNVVQGIQAMIDALNATTPDEEKLAALIAKIKEILAQQNALTKTTVSIFWNRLPEVKEKQEAISDQVVLVTKDVKQLNPKASDELDKAKGHMDNIDTALKSDAAFLNKEENRAKVVDHQHGSSQNLITALELLQQQATAMAEADGNKEDAQAAKDDAARQALQDAVEKITEAKERMQLADQILDRGENPSAATEQMQQAQKALDQGQAKANEASKTAGDGIKENMQRAAQGMSEAQKDMAAGDKPKEHQDLGAAKEAAIHAIEGLSAVADQKAVQDAQAQAQQGPMEDGVHNLSKGSKPGTMISSGGNNNAVGSVASYLPQGGLSAEQRDALSAFQHEKTPAEYTDMVQQYLKNLAAGNMP